MNYVEPKVQMMMNAHKKPESVWILFQIWPSIWILILWMLDFITLLCLLCLFEFFFSVISMKIVVVSTWFALQKLHLLPCCPLLICSHLNLARYEMDKFECIWNTSIKNRKNKRAVIIFHFVPLLLKMCVHFGAAWCTTFCCSSHKAYI